MSKRNFASKYAFDSIFQNLPDHLAKICEIWQIFADVAGFAKISKRFAQFFTNIADFSNRYLSKRFEIAAVQKYANLVELEKCCQTHILNYFLAKFRFDTAENEPAKNLQKNG